MTDDFRKVVESLYIFLATSDEVENILRWLQSSYSHNGLCHTNINIFNLFDPELQLINTKTNIENKLNKLLSEMKKFKVQSILILQYKRNKVIPSASSC